MKGLRERSFSGLRENLWLSPAREILPQAIFFCLRRCYGQVRMPTMQSPLVDFLGLVSTRDPWHKTLLLVTFHPFCSEKRLIRLTFWDTLWEQFGLSDQLKCSHRCVSLTETSLKPVQILKHTTKNSAKQTAMRTKLFKHIAIKLFRRISYLWSLGRRHPQSHLWVTFGTLQSFWRSGVFTWYHWSQPNYDYDPRERNSGAPGLHFTVLLLGGRFGYFLFFFCSREGKGSPRRRKGAGVRFLMKISGGGGGSPGGRGVEGPGGCLRRMGNLGGGGGLNIFLGGRNVHQDFQPWRP